MFRQVIGKKTFEFKDLKDLLAKATPLRSGDVLANLAAQDATQRIAAQLQLAEVPLETFVQDPLIPYEEDEVTRLILDSFDRDTFKTISHLSVGTFRDWLLSDEATTENLRSIKWALTPEMVAAVSKLMSLQDLILVAKKCQITTAFRTTIGLPGRFSTRLQPNHPSDDIRGIAASMLDGLRLGSGDAVIGINPAGDDVQTQTTILKLLEELRLKFNIPIQACVLSHLTNTLKAIENKAPVDLVFQSIGGSQKLNQSFGINLALLQEGKAAGESLRRGTVGQQLMYFETGQGSGLSAEAHHGLDQQTLEVRAYSVARAFDPLLVNTVVGFIGPEYLYDGKQIIRAGLEDHFCGKLLGLPMGCDICYTNHSSADQDDMDNLLTLLGAAGCSFIMGVPGADDVMLGYQSTSFQDALYIRRLLGLRPAPEFEKWLQDFGLFDAHFKSLSNPPALQKLLENLDA